MNFLCTAQVDKYGGIEAVRNVFTGSEIEIIGYLFALELLGLIGAGSKYEADHAYAAKPFKEDRVHR